MKKLTYLEAVVFSQNIMANRVNYKPSNFRDHYNLLELGLINSHNVLAGKETYQNGRSLIWIQNGITLVGAVLQ